MLKDLIRQAQKVLDEKNPPEKALVEIENAISAFLEAVATDRVSQHLDFSDLEHANRLLREVRRERSRRLAESQSQETSSPEPSPRQEKVRPVPNQQPVRVSPEFGGDDTYDPLRKFLSSSHDPDAEAVMDQAEEAFYAGNYQKAIPLFEQVLQIEPGWSRAQEHHDEAEEFLRTGNIPSVALPPEAGKAYGKAQSAARVFRYQIALGYLEEAFESLQEAGINRWREGESLRQDLENQMQANEVYQEGLSLIRQGDLTGGLSKIQTAASAVALPEYVDKVTEIRKDIASLDEISDTVNLTGNIPPGKLAEARQKLEKLAMKYGDIPQVTRLRNRMDMIIPTVIDTLIAQIRRLQRQGDAANTFKQAKEAYQKALENLETLKNLQSGHQEAQTLAGSLQESLDDIESLEESLNRANQALVSESRFFPRNAFAISKSVRARFPQDPDVLTLKKKMRWYKITLYGGGAIAGVLLILLIWLAGRGISNAVQQRRLSLTPSATATATLTMTPTITSTPTQTPTATPEVTDTPESTPSPTPVINGTLIRTVWARNGCYEGTTANGRIPEGAVVTLIAQPERVFDEFNRECVLVEYRAEETNVIGYVLLIDLTIP